MYLAILFIISNIFFLFDKKRLEKNFKDIDKHNKFDFVYYLIQTIFPVWVLVINFTNFSVYTLSLVVLFILKFITYHLNEKIFYYYYLIYPFLIIINLFIILLF